MLTHERRLSALGPGGLNRKRAGFEVRDVHISHYGRICPIETPEGTNIGLISQPGDLRRGRRLRLPDHAVPQGQERQADRRGRLAAGRRGDRGATSPRPTRRSRTARSRATRVIARYRGDFEHRAGRARSQYIDVAPSQMVGVSAGLIPFLEHDDANRALMGSNMQRQAVPLLVTEPPLVGHGHGEATWPATRGMVVRAGSKGNGHLRRCRRASRSTTTSITLRKFVGPQRADLPEPEADRQDRRQGRRRARSSPTAPPRYKGELALGRNVLVAFMSWDGLQLRRRDHHQRRAGARTTPTRRFTSKSSTSKFARRSSAARSSPATFPTSARRRCATSTRTASSGSARS